MLYLLTLLSADCSLSYRIVVLHTTHTVWDQYLTLGAW